MKRSPGSTPACFDMYRVIKRLFDVLFAAAAMAVLSPLLAAVAIAVRVTSPGPVLFRQERAGQGGKPFVLFKFRTMRPDADPFGPSPKSGEDARLTRVGRFLRESSLDELPQLVNILAGDMSLIGPRPLYVSQIAEWDERQRTRLLVKPGLTGLAQVSGRGQLTVEEKLEFDVRYVERAGLLLDSRILLATLVRVFARRGIYEMRYSRAEDTRAQSGSGQKENVDDRRCSYDHPHNPTRTHHEGGRNRAAP
ncbi:MAG TPA: sugar transferase [Sedimentisphaerales bacterium]|jgi:lipopolysaccharide/colanic/teichoic acid biosynthesis glycosyltransferase|nr:sugar transferase [Sedimentisphaerales bacterium]HNU31676.1 sugar transferase [Sedimentisphaerales bacterium]